MTHKNIANKFKAGQSVSAIAFSMCHKKDGPLVCQWDKHRQYVERAIREVLKRQHRRHYGR